MQNLPQSGACRLQKAFLKHALETEIFILGPYLQKAENNLASKVLSKMRIGVILSL